MSSLLAPTESITSFEAESAAPERCLLQTALHADIELRLGTETVAEIALDLRSARHGIAELQRGELTLLRECCTHREFECAQFGNPHPRAEHQQRVLLSTSGPDHPPSTMSGMATFNTRSAVV